MPIVIVGTELYSGGGIEKPLNKDQGNDVFSTIEDFMERIATHDHTGQDSKQISLNISKDIELFQVGVNLTWTAQGNDTFQGAIAVPVATTYDASIRKFYFDDGAGNFAEFYPRIEKVDANNYFIYVNDNTLDVRVVTL